MEDLEQNGEKRKRMSCGLYSDCPESLKTAIRTAFEYGFHFLVTQITHPSFIKEFDGPDAKYAIGRNDTILKSNEWGRLIVGKK